MEDHRDHAGPKLQGYQAQNLLMAPRSKRSDRKLYLKLKYVKKVGIQRLMMGVVLVGKRGHDLQTTKTEFKQGKLSLLQGSKQIFPLLVIRGNSNGIQILKGNENYIRSLYRERWAIEIAFRRDSIS